MEEEKVVNSSKGVKIIMTTALDDPKNVVGAFKSLCDAYLVKPVNKSKLLDYMRSFGLIIKERLQRLVKHYNYLYNDVIILIIRRS